MPPKKKGRPLTSEPPEVVVRHRAERREPMQQSTDEHVMDPTSMLRKLIHLPVAAAPVLSGDDQRHFLDESSASGGIGSNATGTNSSSSGIALADTAQLAVLMRALIFVARLRLVQCGSNSSLNRHVPLVGGRGDASQQGGVVALQTKNQQFQQPLSSTAPPNEETPIPSSPLPRLPQPWFVLDTPMVASVAQACSISLSYSALTALALRFPSYIEVQWSLTPGFHQVGNVLPTTPIPSHPAASSVSSQSAAAAASLLLGTAAPGPAAPLFRILVTSVPDVETLILGAAPPPIGIASGERKVQRPRNRSVRTSTESSPERDSSEAAAVGTKRHAGENSPLLDGARQLKRPRQEEADGGGGGVPAVPSAAAVMGRAIGAPASSPSSPSPFRSGRLETTLETPKHNDTPRKSSRTAAREQAKHAAAVQAAMTTPIPVRPRNVLDENAAATANEAALRASSLDLPESLLQALPLEKQSAVTNALFYRREALQSGLAQRLDTMVDLDRLLAMYDLAKALFGPARTLFCARRLVELLTAQSRHGDGQVVIKRQLQRLASFPESGFSLTFPLTAGIENMTTKDNDEPFVEGTTISLDRTKCNRRALEDAIAVRKQSRSE